MPTILNFRFRVRWLSAIFFVFLILSGSAFAKNMPQPVVVSMYDDYYSPETITVEPEQTVIWINKGHKAHTVTSSKGYFNSGRLIHGARFSYIFTKPGTYKFYCSYHTFFMFGMRGVVKVV